MLFPVMFLFPHVVLAEGTKQVCPTVADGGDLAITNTYTQFALYNCPWNYRLNIHISNVGEQILFGLRTTTNNRIWQLKNPSNVTVMTGTCPSPTNGQPGLISNYAQAVAGPFPGSGGYTPISYTVTTTDGVGDFYLEFNGNVTFTLYDFTVVSGLNSPTLPSDVKDGRVWSCSWQFNSPLTGGGPFFSAKMYVYSDDGIVTRCEYNQAHVGTFTMFCNSVGCVNTGNFTNDRRSRNNNSSTTFPGIAQYKVFFNNPDSIVYPNGVYGVMIGTPSIIPDPNFPVCSGNKFVVINVNKQGNVQVKIDVPYGDDTYDVFLYSTVSSGTNNIAWNGKDGHGNMVPDGTILTITVSYANGLTNLPIWDQEQNPNGYIVALIRPINPSIQNPMVYWDDSQLTSGGQCFTPPNTTNLTGCTPSTTGCHVWPGPDCHDKMINTWWYSASSSTATLNYFYTGTPPNPVPHGDANCGPGRDTLHVTVLPYETADWYDAPIGGNLLLSGDTVYITPVIAITTTYYAVARNDTSGCLSVARSPVVATIYPIPNVTFNPASESICSGDTTMIVLGSNVSSSTFSWTCSASSANVTGYSPATHLNTIEQELTNSGNTPETVTYHVSATANNCNGPPYDVVVTVNPIPHLTNDPPTDTICSTESTNINLTSNVAGTNFTWTANLLSGNITGFSDGSGNIITQVLTNNLNTNGTVIYTISMIANGCSGKDTAFLVVVKPKPQVTTTPLNYSICTSGTTDITLASGVAGGMFTWTASGSSGSVTGYTNGSGNKIQETLYNSSYIDQTVIYQVVAHASGCNGDTTSFVVTVFPVPDLTNTPLSQQQCDNTNTNISLLSNVNGTLFTWNCTPSSGNVTGFSNSTTSTNLISQVLVNTGNNIETVIYHITPEANGCFGSVYNDTVTVYPTSLLTNIPLAKQLCNNTNTNITLTSNVTATSFTWTCTASSGNVTGYSDNSIPTTILNQTLVNIGFSVETVTYHITPRANGCDGITSDYIVTVYPTPDLSFTPNGQTICSGTSTGILLSSNVSGTTFAWTVSASSPNLSGFADGSGNNITQALSNSGNTIETVTYTVTPTANSCSGPSQQVAVTVNPVTHITTSPLTDAFCSGGTTSINLAATVSGTTFAWTALPSSGNLGGFANGTGSTIIQSLTNSGSTIETVTYQIVPTANGCTGTTSNFLVTVYPIPTLTNDPLFSQLCNATPTNITLLSGVAGANFTWTATGSSPNIIGYGPGSGTMINQVLTNTGFNTEFVTYHITPSANGCTGPLTDFLVTIVSQPDVYFNPPAPAICSQQSTNIQVLSHVPSSTFTWTAIGSSPNVSGYSGGSGNLIAQSLTNSGTTIETVLYIATPTAFGCPGGIADSVIVTVYPTPHVTNNLLTQSICSSSSSSISLTSDVAGSTFSWTASSSSPNLTGFSGGSGLSINQLITNTGFNIDTVYYHVTPIANGCSGPVTTFKVTVFPTPDLSNSPKNKSICNNTSTSINLTSNVANTLFTWTCTPSSADVTGYSNNITPTALLNQTLVNSGFNNETVTYHVTPHANGCNGLVSDYTVTVFPVANLSNSPLNKAICNNTNTNINLTSNVPGTSFTWTTTPSSANVSGYSNNSTPTIFLSQTLVNSGFAVETVTYHILPNANGCNGNNTDFTVTVYPTPNLSNSPPAKQICNNGSTNVTLTSSVSGTLFTWTANGSSGNVSGFSNNSTLTVTLNQTLMNSGFLIESVTYHVTPHANGCDGPVTDFVLTVFPTPDVYFQPSSLTICSGQTTSINILSHVASTTFSWNASGSSGNVSGYSNSNGNNISQTLTNTGNTIETVTYLVSPSANGCPGNAQAIVVNVNPTPHVTTSPLSQAICTSNNIAVNLTSSVSGSTFAWTCTPSSPNLSGFSAGTGSLISQTLSNTGFTIETVSYHITPSANNCAGPVTDYVVTVYPKPDVSNNPLTSSICSGYNTNISLTSHVAGANFSWTATGSSPNIIGYGPGSGLIISQVLTNLGLNPESVIYHILPSANGCNGNITDFTVNIAQIPDVYFNPVAQTICSQQSCNISILSHVGGATFSWTASSSSLNISGFSNGSGDLIAQVLINSGTTIETVTYTVYPSAFGCPPGIPQNVVVTVNPRPLVTNSVKTSQICSASATNIIPQSNVTGTSFTWTATGSSGNVSGYSNGSGLAIVQVLANAGFNLETVTYAVIPIANSCPGTPENFIATVFPVPDVYFTPPSQTLCSGFTSSISLSSHVTGAAFTWTASGSSGNVTGYSPGNGSLINQTLTNSGYMVENVDYTAFPTANGCPGTSNHVIITVDPTPTISFIPCWDPVTTIGAQPFKLKGGSPQGGTYSGTGVNVGIFYPGLAGPGSHPINFTYTNTWGCSNTAYQTITVLSPMGFVCGNNLMDIRDNKQYPTVQIGTQCWMAANLDYGTTIPATSMQRDNCSPEKYCFNDNPANCSTMGGLYQWDELMKFDNASGSQGICPPGWHIPTENDWNTVFNFYISNGFAGSPLKYDGYSGFNAFLWGIRFENASWSFSNFATMFWSSTAQGPLKAWAHGMNTYNPSVSKYPGSRSNAFHVRCIKD